MDRAERGGGLLPTREPPHVPLERQERVQHRSLLGRWVSFSYNIRSLGSSNGHHRLICSGSQVIGDCASSQGNKEVGELMWVSVNRQETAKIFPEQPGRRARNLCWACSPRQGAGPCGHPGQGEAASGFQLVLIKSTRTSGPWQDGNLSEREAVSQLTSPGSPKVCASEQQAQTKFLQPPAPNTHTHTRRSTVS